MKLDWAEVRGSGGLARQESPRNSWVETHLLKVFQDWEWQVGSGMC